MKKKLFGTHIERDCAYCQNFKTEGKDGGSCLLKKKEQAVSCRCFVYDPLKRTPRQGPVLPDYRKEDFSL